MALMMDRPADVTVEEFLDDFLTTMLVDLHSFQENNFDAGRFNHDDVDRSEIFDLHSSKAMLVDILANANRYFQVWQRFDDVLSRELFHVLMRYRVGGHLHVRLPTNCMAYERARLLASAVPATPSSLAIGGPWPLRHFELSFRGRDLKVDCMDILPQFILGQYFFDREGVSIQPRPGDHVIDMGACVGDSALAFAAAVGEGGRVHAFDFCDAHIKAIAYNAVQNPWAPVTIHPVGLSDRCQEGSVLVGDDVRPGQTAHSMDNPPLSTLDALVAANTVERVDFIKMDIEGSELQALQGAAETLRRFRPRLALSLYHRAEDFYTIPEFIDSLGLGYRLYLDHYTIHQEETVLYATTEAP